MAGIIHKINPWSRSIKEWKIMSAYHGKERNIVKEGALCVWAKTSILYNLCSLMVPVVSNHSLSNNRVYSHTDPYKWSEWKLDLPMGKLNLFGVILKHSVLFFQWVSVLFPSAVCTFLYILLESCRIRPLTLHMIKKEVMVENTWFKEGKVAFTELFVPQLKTESHTKKHVCTGTQNGKLTLVTLFMSLCSNSLYKNSQNNFYSCKCGNCFRWNVISWFCVCWQDFHNEQVAICLMCISHIWLEVTNLHCLSKLNTWLLILYGSSE